MIPFPLAELLTFSDEFKIFFDAKPVGVIAGSDGSLCVPEQNSYKISYDGKDHDGWMVLKNGADACLLLEIRDGTWKAYFPRGEKKILHTIFGMLESSAGSSREAWNRLRFLMREAHTEAHKEKGNANYLSDFLVEAYLSMDAYGFIDKRTKAC
jgi:hypothetical protein